MQEWFGSDFVDARVKLLNHSEHLFKTEAQRDLLDKDEPHVIDSPKICNSCELWGEPFDENGRCPGCAEEAMPCESE
jgi:hypothetical protein